MFRPASILLSIIATTCAGNAIIASLTMGHDTLQPILIAAAIGGVVAIPITWIVATRYLRHSSFGSLCAIEWGNPFAATQGKL